MELIVDLNEFSELCGVTAETMRGYIKAVDPAPAWLIKRGHRGVGYEIEPLAGVEWWRAKCEADDMASAERRAQLAQLRFDLLGDAVEDTAALSLSGKQRLEDYNATLKRIELLRVMRNLVEREPLEVLLAEASVEHRRALELLPNEMMVRTGMSQNHAQLLHELLGKTIDEFWDRQFLPAKAVPDA